MATFAAKPEHWSALPTDAVAVNVGTGGSPGQSYRLTVRLTADSEPLKRNLEITSSAWSPALYLPTVQTLLARLKLGSPPTNESGPGTLPDADLLTALTAPLTAAMEAQNQRLSRLLSATLLERLELFRVLGEAISIEQAVTRLGSFEPPTAPDWSRIVMQAGGGVGVGRSFTLPSIGREMADARQVFPAVQGATTPERFVAIYNQPADDAVGVAPDGQTHFHVIGRGLWAQWFQRHLLQSADETNNFLEKQLGVPDDAKAFRGKVQPFLRGLTLYPLCFAGLGKEDGEALFSRAADLVNGHPEQVGDAAWYEVIKKVPARYATGGAWLPVSEQWFTPRLPTGTAYGFYWREGHGGILPPLDTTELTKLHAIAPLQ